MSAKRKPKKFRINLIACITEKTLDVGFHQDTRRFVDNWTDYCIVHGFIPDGGQSFHKTQTLKFIHTLMDKVVDRKEIRIFSMQMDGEYEINDQSMSSAAVKTTIEQMYKEFLKEKGCTAYPHDKIKTINVQPIYEGQK